MYSLKSCDRCDRIKVNKMLCDANYYFNVQRNLIVIWVHDI